MIILYIAIAVNLIAMGLGIIVMSLMLKDRAERKNYGETGKTTNTRNC